MRREWIARVDISPDVAMKLAAASRNLTPEQVRSAICFDRYETASFNPETPYGPRLYVIGTSEDNVRIQAALEPVDREDGHWDCRTAVRRPKGDGWK